MTINVLEDKWGPFEKSSNYISNGKMPFVSEVARLNVLFDKCDELIIENVFANKLNAPIMPELRQFYNEYNGCRLFFGSLSIFGIAKHPDDTYEPFDLFRENLNNVSKLNKRARKSNKYIFFASLGGDYLFGYDKEDLQKVYCFKPGSLKVEAEYDSFETFWTHFFYGLIDEYDETCHKIHPNIEDEGIPALENVTYKLF